MKSEVTLITPQIAEMLLNGNTGNRRLSEQRVISLAEVMRQGKFKFNGDSIRVSVSGVLLDGQHRLSAIVKSGISQQMLLVTGLPDDVFNTIDIGAARTTSDFLSIKGIDHSMTVAAVSTIQLCFELHGTPDSNNSRKWIAKPDIYERAMSDSDIQFASVFVKSNKNLRNIYTPSYVAWCFYVFCKTDKEAAISFMNELSSGEVSYMNSPVTALRNPLLVGALRKDGKNKVCAYFFRAFRAYLNKENLSVIRIGEISKDLFKI